MAGANTSNRLHLLLAPNAAQDCRAQLQPGDRVVLADRGAGLLLDAEQLDHLLGYLGDALAVSAPDAEALGLTGRAGRLGVPALDDGDWAGLLEECVQVLSWK